MRLATKLWQRNLRCNCNMNVAYKSGEKSHDGRKFFLQLLLQIEESIVLT